jgi:acyl carrier protein
MNTIIETTLRESIDELNSQMQGEAELVYSPEERLLGRTGKLDSISFVTLVAIIEEKLLDSTGKEIYLVTDRAFSQERSPFYDIKSLSAFIEELLKEEE